MKRWRRTEETDKFDGQGASGWEDLKEARGDGAPLHFATATEWLDSHDRGIPYLGDLDLTYRHCLPVRP